jgi:hypothetical protein
VLFVAEKVGIGELATFVAVGPALFASLKGGVLTGPLFLPAGFAGLGAVAGPAALPVCRAGNEWLFAP